MNKERVENYVKYAAAILMSIFALCAPAFALLKITSIVIVPISVKFSGYSLLSFIADSYAPVHYFIFISILLSLIILGLISLLISIISFCKKNQITTASKRDISAMMITQLSLMLLYLISGVLLKINLVNEITAEADLVETIESSVIFSTAVFVPFVLGALVFIIYFTAPYIIKTHTSVPLKKKYLRDISDIPEAILKYKQLLDAGVLTEEEFNQKKNELLNI